MNKIWEKYEDKILEDTSITYSDIAYFLPHRTKSSIWQRCHILGYLRDKNIISKCNSENQRKDIWESLIFDKHFCEVVDGELLADGCIFKKKVKNRNSYEYTFIAGSVHEEYAEYLHSFLSKKLNSKAKIKTIKPCLSFGKICKTFYSVRFSSVVFKNFYERWYPAGSIKTTIPEDLLLTPTMCLHWYLGDGSLYSNKEKYMFDLSLHTENFTIDNVIRLQKNLKKCYV